MPGYNHYRWCLCGWCFKTGSNGYSARLPSIAADCVQSDKVLAGSGANKSWSACFIQPNATCPVCGAKVFYYQNKFGSRVFFDEIGWPWPKHPCTDNSQSANNYSSYQLPVARAREATLELLSYARGMKGIDFDPSANFRSRFGSSSWAILSVLRIVRRGFENYIVAKSLSPVLDEAVFVAFTSAFKIATVGDYFGFNGEEVSFLVTNLLIPKQMKARFVSVSEFVSFEAVGLKSWNSASPIPSPTASPGSAARSRRP